MQAERAATDRWNLPLEAAAGQAELLPAGRARQWVLAFVLLGIATRAVRYALRFPLWEDECFLSANFLQRGYLELCGPLEYFQVCPLGFLWVQLTLVKLLGFTEYSLRLFALLCGLGSLLLLVHLAGRLLTGTALVLAVAIFSVSYPAIRYAAEAKQYGAELLVSVVLLTLAVRWSERPERTGWLWAAAALAPVAVFLSYTAAFVGGAISLFAAWTIWRTRLPRGWIAWLVLNVALAGSLAALWLVSARHQSARSLGIMQRAWQGGFPPLGQPLQLAGWLVLAHTSELLAYPVGGRRGASAVTLLVCAAGLALLGRKRRWPLMGLLVSPLALSLMAAALRWYPYGQMTKFQLFAAPSICILAGLGAAALVHRPLGGPKARRLALRLALGLLAAIGLGSIGRDLVFPAKSPSVMRARDFARWFWFTAEYEGEVACLKTDLGQMFSPGTFKWGLSAVYLCNQRIYSPRHARGEPVAWERVSADRPLRCVEYHTTEHPYDAAAQARWLQAMQTRYLLVGRERYPFAQVRSKGEPARELDYLEVYTFVPRPRVSQSPGSAQR